MRILHVVSSMDSRNGGPAIAVAGLARAQQAKSIELRAATSLFRLHRTAPTRSLIARLSAAQKLIQLPPAEPR